MLMNAVFMDAHKSKLLAHTTFEPKNEEGRKTVLDMLRKYRPAAIFVAALDPTVRRIAELITEILNELRQDPTFTVPTVQLGEDDTARFYINPGKNVSESLRELDVELSPTGRYCVGLCRRQLQPETEYALLPKEDLLAISWHPSQSMVCVRAFFYLLMCW